MAIGIDLARNRFKLKPGHHKVFKMRLKLSIYPARMSINSKKIYLHITRGGNMLSWCIILFGLGVLAFLDTIFNYGEIFRRINSVVFMLISLGLLVRLSMMARTGEKEKLQNRNAELEKKVETNRPVEANQPVG